MVTRTLWAWGTGLFAVGLLGAGCSASNPREDDAGGYEADPESIEGRQTSFQPGCKKQLVASYALGGTLLLPTGPAAGYVLVTDEKIAAVVATRTELPAGTNVVETGGVISPGLMDLHNHVAYDYLPLWNSGRRWSNRYQWAGAASYAAAIKAPYNAVKAAGHTCEGVKYGELRALVGGSTTIQGSADLACTRSWARNVEFENFCEDHVRQDVLPITALKQADADQLNQQFASGKTKAFFVHLAEGIDDSSRNEFERLRTLGLLKPQVVGIHSTALNPAQLQEMGRNGMKIVWSPLSNLILYGKTTDIPTALASGVTVSIAPDWSPSGSSNVLGELKVADRVNKERFSGAITDQQLWQMVTANPAMTAGLDDKLGRIAPGYFADLVVVRGDVAAPYRAIIDAKPGDVLLTTVSGVAFYGAPTLVQALGQPKAYTTVDACGEPRSLAVTESNAAIPLGTESLADLQATFVKDGVPNVIPLFQCDAAPEWAFH